MLKVTFTLLPGTRTALGFGLCLVTLPFLAVAPSSFLTLPSLQPAFLRRVLAAFSLFFLRFGTTHAL